MADYLLIGHNLRVARVQDRHFRARGGMLDVMGLDEVQGADDHPLWRLPDDLANTLGIHPDIAVDLTEDGDALPI